MTRIQRWLVFVVLLVLPYTHARAQTKTLDDCLLDAMRATDTAAARALLSRGANVNAKDDHGLTALMYAALYGGADCVGLLLQRGADLNAKSDAEVTALMLAVNDASKVKLLLAKGAEVNAKSKQGHTALSLAAGRVGSAAVVKALLDHGAELPAVNLLGAAARTGDVQVMKLLLSHGADPNDQRNLGGAPPITAKRANERGKENGPPSIPAFGLPANLGGTPLMFAALERAPEAVKLLLAAGAQINARNHTNSTALMLAAQMGDPAIVRLLLENGAEVNARNDWGYTALLYAAATEQDDPALLEALLAKGADLNVKAKDGETALTLAGRKGRSALLGLLKQAGGRKSQVRNREQ